MYDVKPIDLQTHVEVLIYDPFPTMDGFIAEEGSTDEEIVKAARAKYRDNLITLVLYEISTVEINGIAYKSEPLNRRRAQ